MTLGALLSMLLAPACAWNVEHGSGLRLAPAGPNPEPIVEATRLERVSTAVPWPRGVRYWNGKLLVLARGVHRSAGGPNPEIPDLAGHIFTVDPDVHEPVVKGKAPGEAVRKNATVLAVPTNPPFHLWNRELPSTSDTLTDRPYCMLVADEPSRNLFVCGYSGIDLPRPRKFRKNATDSILRYDLRNRKWHVVDQHDPGVVPKSELEKCVAPHYYPHHDPAENPPPHGLVNGPCGAVIAGHYLYVGAKDNTALAQYDLTEIRRNPDAPPPPARYIFHRSDWKDNVFVEVKGHGNTYVEGTCALAVRDGYLYVAFRTTSQILRFPLESDGDVVRPLTGELIALFTPYDPKKKGGSANIYDMTFDRRGRLYVSPGYDGSVYCFTPDPGRIYDARDGYATPYVDLMKLVGAKKSGNICFDPDGNLYICSGKKELPEGKVRGAIYRVPAP
jgi:hypothetical protein